MTRFGRAPVRAARRDKRTVATGRDIDQLPSGRAIANALDFREIGSPARRSITAGAGTEAVAP